MALHMMEIGPKALRCVSPENVVFFLVEDSNSPHSVHGYPANGGIFIRDYEGESAAINEAYALAERMTYKHALYNTGFVGAKIVVCAPPDQLDKPALLDAIALALKTHSGEVYTGTDLNTSDRDMQYLSRHSPYVLAGVGSAVVPSAATAAGVYGAIAGVLGVDYVRNNRFLVHGFGKVGRRVAEQLKAAGAEVLIYDVLPERTDGAGFRSVSGNPIWWTEAFDVLVPCSGPNVITPAIIRELTCSSIIGATNKPFTDTVTAVDHLAEQSILWVPDFVSNGGAVIADSIEHHAPDVFRNASADAVYAFISALVARMSRRILEQYKWGGGMAMNDILTDIIDKPPTEPLCGLLFAANNESPNPAGSGATR